MAQGTRTVLSLLLVICSVAVAFSVWNDWAAHSEPAKITTAQYSAVAADAVNINTASAKQLQTLEGIGAAKARAIIKYREENGDFVNKSDLLLVNGIGQRLYETIKESITV